MTVSLAISVLVNRFLSALNMVFRVLSDYSVTDRKSLNRCQRCSLILVRYLLLALTSFFYLVGPPANSFHIKLIVVSALVLATVLAQNLYDTWFVKPVETGTDLQDYNGRLWHVNGGQNGLFKLVLAETLGIALLIIPTGGLDSPFAWYALNPIITAAYFTPGFYGWIVLGLFLTLACGISQLYPDHSSYFFFIRDHLSQLLVFFLTTSMVHIASSLHKTIVIAYDNAEAAYQACEKSLLHISSLYQALEAFSTRKDHQQLAELLAEFTSRLVSAPAACFLHKRVVEEFIPGHTVLCLSPTPVQPEVDWHEEIKKLWSQVESEDDFLVKTFGANSRITARPIVSHGQCFGLLAFWDAKDLNQSYEENKKTLQFLADLGGITLERFQSDLLWGRLLVSEEQNRISNELHDTIAQYLFSITCALHTLSRDESDLQDQRVQEQLTLLINTAQRAASELRASIYNLNPAKRGESIFIDNLASYLDDLGRLNRVKVDLQVKGDEDTLSPALRKGLYRIVREACSNAVRHGHCTELKVSLSMNADETILAIKDDGCSFNSKSGNWKPGLGIRNMRQIAADFNGMVQIQRNPDRGTLVLCTIPRPNGHELNCKEVSIV